MDIKKVRGQTWGKEENKIKKLTLLHPLPKTLLTSYMEYFFPILLMIFAILVVTRPITIICHELGHAIPIILLTKEAVTVYIGSYGDVERCFKLTIGKLSLFIRYNPLKWRGGLCVPLAKDISRNQQIIYTVSGPIASSVISGIACYFTFAYDLHGFLKLFLIVLLGSAALDLYMNLRPNPMPVVLADGTSTYNDGYTLKLLISGNAAKLSTGGELYSQQRYAEAAVFFEEALSSTKDARIYRLAINAYLQDKNYQKAKELSDEFSLTGPMNSNDFSSVALANSLLGFYDVAMEQYDKSLALDPVNKYSLNNKGYTLNLLSRFEEAIVLFDKAIALDNDFAYSFNNRGLSKIKQGLREEGLQDINYSFTLDPDNSYAYRNLGIYHSECGEFHEALKLFIKAKEKDTHTHMIDELINEAEKKILSI